MEVDWLVVGSWRALDILLQERSGADHPIFIVTPVPSPSIIPSLLRSLPFSLPGSCVGL